FREKTRRSYTLRKVDVRSIFCALSQKFKILAIPNIFACRKSYEHGFIKKCDGHKLCIRSRFDRIFMHHLARKVKILAIPNVLAQAQKFKILTIPNVLAYEKSYEHGFTKKNCYDHNLCAKSRFDRYFVLRLISSKY
ncbi:hypothetical protein GW17_00032189, partial [Ensete ventricosum]